MCLQSTFNKTTTSLESMNEDTHTGIPLPDAFVAQMTSLLGAEAANQLLQALNETSPTSLRLNSAHPQCEAISALPVPWCRQGRYLPSRPAFTFDPLLHAGVYYVQEAASMFVEQAYLACQNSAPQRVLDLCAAPGGKSTLWRSLLPQGTLLVANEPLTQRAHILSENMQKWGHPDVVVTNAYPNEFAPLRGFFDIIAADVPCSGEGMFRKDPNARTEWSLSAVDTCATRQRQIITDVWPALREGGFLVYSTCTFNAQEDEENVNYICSELGAKLISIPHLDTWGISGSSDGSDAPVYHFYPHLCQGEGFFLALMQKTAATPTGKDKRKRNTKKSTTIGGIGKAAAWLRHSADFKISLVNKEEIHAYRHSLADDIERITDTVRVLSAGIPLATVKGNKLVPQHGLALSNELAKDAFPKAELSYEEAIAYLRRDALHLDISVPRGYVLACYEGFPLGFLNNLGNRANNMYPAEWRIRTTHTPERPQVIKITDFIEE